MTIKAAVENGFPYWAAWGSVIEGWARAAQGEVQEGLAELRQGVAEYRATGSELFRPYNLALLAEVCGNSGFLDEGVALIDEALADGSKTGVGFVQAELYRLQGELRDASGHTQREVEGSYERALKIARTQGARCLELRATTSLAALWCRDTPRPEARSLLTGIIERFDEGLDTQDLKQARALLEQFS